MPLLKNNVGIYANKGRNNCVNLSMSLEAYTAMGEPAAIIFSEVDRSIHTPTLNTNKEYKVLVQQKRAICTVMLFYTSPDNLVGSWNYEVGDLSLTLTTKQ